METPLQQFLALLTAFKIPYKRGLPVFGDALLGGNPAPDRPAIVGGEGIRIQVDGDKVKGYVFFEARFEFIGEQFHCMWLVE